MRKWLGLFAAGVPLMARGTVGCSKEGGAREATKPADSSSAAAAAAPPAAAAPATGDTIKVGILHSLSGTMAISETSLRDVALMTIDEINAKGGILGKKIEPVVVDPASNW